MVRAIKLESTTSGSYENAAQGVFWSAAPGTDVIIAAAALSTRNPSQAHPTSSPDAAPIAGSANTAALTIASSGPSTSRDGGSASGESAPRNRPTGNPPTAVANAPSASN
jgi:hypothetical protein